MKENSKLAFHIMTLSYKFKSGFDCSKEY